MTGDGDLAPILDSIRERGGRVTAQRVAILRALLDGPHHATVETLQARLSQTDPDIHEATFYRTLSALEDLGVLYHLHLDHGPSVWHLTADQHEHLACRGCGTVIEVEAGELDALRQRIADRYGFELDTHHFVSQGLCRACARTAHPDAAHDPADDERPPHPVHGRAGHSHR